MVQAMNTMKYLRALVLTSVIVFQIFSPIQAGYGPNKLERNVTDAFKAIEALPYAIGISDSNNDGIFECLTAIRTEFDLEAKTATYIWSLNEGPEQPRKHYTFLYMAGATPDAPKYIVGKGTSEESDQVEYFRYSDYKDCIVSESTYFGEACTLWVSKDVKDLVPQYCLEQFDDICGYAVPLYIADICEDDYTDVGDEDF